MTASTSPPDLVADPASQAVSTRVDEQSLRTLMRGGSKTFFAASLLLPARVRASATALYAFCRLADDAIDLGDDKHAAVRDLTQRLDAIYRGQPRDIEADRALVPVVVRHHIPRALLDALIEGFVWDAQGRQYETLTDLQAYGARVAGTVGAMMALIMGVRSPGALARACELGVAMQLTNIARDVGEDARAARLFLPMQWLREAGVDPQAWLRYPVFDDTIASVIDRLLHAADDLYLRAQGGIGALPRDCRPAIRAAQTVYAEIGQQVRRLALDSVNHRAVVPGSRKLVLIAQSTGSWLLPPRATLPEPRPLPAIQFLVDAAVAGEASDATVPSSSARVTVPSRSFDEKMIWASDLFARLAEHDRSPR